MMLILISLNWLNNIAYAIRGYGERNNNRGGKNMKYEEAAQAHHTTAAMRFRLASPKLPFATLRATSHSRKRYQKYLPKLTI